MLTCTKQKQNILKSQNKDLDLKVRENELEEVKKTKYLCVQIDSSLDWKEQIKAVSSKVSRAEMQKHCKPGLEEGFGQKLRKVLLPKIKFYFVSIVL